MSAASPRRSHAEALARALWLVEIALVDVRTHQLDPATALRVRLEALGLPDERVYQRAAQRLVAAPPSLDDNLAWLCNALFEMRHGVPVLCSGSLPRRLARVIDPDALTALHPALRVPTEETFDWGAVPVRHDGETPQLLRDQSLETHIHLGGSLPPVFYWVALMGGELSFDTLQALPSMGRGHTVASSWQTSLGQALWLRFALLRRLLVTARRQGLAAPFPCLPPVDDPAWRVFADEGQDSSLKQRAQVLQLGQAGRRSWRGQRAWPFWDPLRDDPAQRFRPHYAAGERRLLQLLGAHLQSSTRDDEPSRAAFAAQLLRYLRCRNAFHQALVHDRGTEGLLRFVESFGKRGFVFGRRTRKRGPRQRRHRRLVLQLEKSRMTAALDEQLVAPYPKPFAGGHHAPIRRLEMRVSVPRGTLFLPTLRAWLEGIRDHLCPLPAPWRKAPVPRSSQVGLLFHFLKRGNHARAGEQADHAARRLGGLLRSYPKLRPWILGIDAAGDERSSSPRVFGPAFLRLRGLEQTHRPRTDEAAITLGRTFHVGEDVADLLTGLRHIDEVVRLLLGQAGGRLGHALALAEDPARFYARRGGQTEPELGSHLLDLVWAWGRFMTEHDAGDALWLEEQIQHLGGFTDKPARIGDCYRKMGLNELVGEATRAPLREDELLTHLGFVGPADQPITLESDPHWLALVSRRQEALRHDLARRRLCIEANPTSNLIIGGYKDYADLPYGALVDSRLAVSLNTDDPGLFMTSLPGELAALYRSFNDDVPHRERISWLADRIFDGEQSTFLGPQVPLGRDAFAATAAALDRFFEYRPG